MRKILLSALFFFCTSLSSFSVVDYDEFFIHAIIPGKNNTTISELTIRNLYEGKSDIVDNAGNVLGDARGRVIIENDIIDLGRGASLSSSEGSPLFSVEYTTNKVPSAVTITTSIDKFTLVGDDKSVSLPMAVTEETGYNFNNSGFDSLNGGSIIVSFPHKQEDLESSNGDEWDYSSSQTLKLSSNQLESGSANQQEPDWLLTAWMEYAVKELYLTEEVGASFVPGRYEMSVVVTVTEGAAG